MTGQLWKDYSEKVYHYFRKRIRDGELAGDLTQDTFQKVLINRDQLERIRNEEAWIFQIARNTLVDYTRKKKEARLGETTLPDNQNRGDNMHSITQGISNCLRELIEEYEEPKQEMLLSVFTNSLSQKEASQYLDVPYSTLKSRIQKAREEIIDEFNKRCCELRYNGEGQIIGCSPV